MSLSRFSILIIFLFFFSSAIPPGGGLTDDILKYTNDYRRAKGLVNLELRSDLNNIARSHSEDMAKGKRSFGHGGFDQRVVKVKKIFKSCSVAENVAYGANNAKEVFGIWKKSSDHRKNMLGNYRYIGIGTAKSKQGVIYYTEIFVR